MNAIEENNVNAAGQTDGFSRISRIGDKGKRVLILGNSITRHPPAPELGWLSDCGMAASCAEKDYVHLLYNCFKAVEDVCFCVFQASDFECTFSEQALMPELSEAEAFGADLIIGRLGENVSSGKFQPGEWARAYGALLDKCARPDTEILLTCCFWKNEQADADIRFLGKERNWKVVELGDLGDSESMKAKGRFKHSGVAAHPGDEGMRRIAERIFEMAEAGKR